MLLHWPETLMNKGLSTLFGSELRVTFCSNTIKLELLKINFVDGLGQKPIIQQTISLDEEPSYTIAPKLLDKLAHMLRDPTWHHAAPVAVFSSALVRYAVLAWNAEITSKQERSVYLQHAFMNNFGDASKDWLMCEHIAGYGKASLASGIDQTLLKQVEAVFEAAGRPLKAAHPLLMLASNQAIGYIKQNKLAHSFWLVCEENQRLVLALIKNGDWQLVRNVAMEVDKEAQLQSLMQREILLSEIESDLPILVYVDDKICLFDDAKHGHSSVQTTQSGKRQIQKWAA